MGIAKAITIVFASTVLFTALGGAVGYGLGTYSPEYYRSLFPRGRHPEFDPVSVGVGQGIGQGMVGGVAVGLVLVALLGWFATRVAKATGQTRVVID